MYSIFKNYSTATAGFSYCFFPANPRDIPIRALSPAPARAAPPGLPTVPNYKAPRGPNKEEYGNQNMPIVLNFLIKMLLY